MSRPGDELRDAARRAVEVIGRIRAFGDVIGPDVSKAEIACVLHGLREALRATRPQRARNAEAPASIERTSSADADRRSSIQDAAATSGSESNTTTTTRRADMATSSGEPPGEPGAGVGSSEDDRPEECPSCGSHYGCRSDCTGDVS